MKKVLIIGMAILLLTGCGEKKEVIDNSNVDISDMPDVRGNENVKVNELGDKVNTSSKLSTEKKYDNYIITDGKIKTDKEGRTTFSASIKNSSSDVVNGGLIDIIFVDNKNNKVSKLPTYIRTLNASEVMELNASIDKDLSNAYDYYFEKHS